MTQLSISFVVLWVINVLDVAALYVRFANMRLYIKVVSLIVG